MKKKFIILLLIVIVFSGICLYFLQPKPIVAETNLYGIHRVVRNEENEVSDVTEKIDTKTLERIIGSYKCSRVPHSFAPYPQQSVICEINGIYNNEPLHIILGDINVVYKSAEKGGYQIKNSEALLAEINALLNEQ